MRGKGATKTRARETGRERTSSVRFIQYTEGVYANSEKDSTCNKIEMHGKSSRLLDLDLSSDGWLHGLFRLNQAGEEAVIGGVEMEVIWRDCRDLADVDMDMDINMDMDVDMDMDMDLLKEKAWRSCSRCTLQWKNV
eukprot:716672-Amorphochlora_amoeboformis.AAC.1